MRWIRWFRDVGIDDVPLVGGKNASLGEMIRSLSDAGVRVPDGFAVTAEAFRAFLQHNALVEPLTSLLGRAKGLEPDALVALSDDIRQRVLAAPIPDDIADEVRQAYAQLSKQYGADAADVAVRSSATAEDLPNASFAGQQESFLHVRGADDVLDSMRRAFASLYTPRAISYREDMGFEHLKVALSVGVQKMVRADRASAGVLFTLDPESGHRGFVLVTSSWGLAENLVQGRVAPDQFYVHKEALRQGFRPIVGKRLGTKEQRLAWSVSGPQNESVPQAERDRFSLTDDDVLQLARWGVAIERHYSRRRVADVPMDVEWAKDGETGELFIVQARPETVHSQRQGTRMQLFRLTGQGEPLVRGLAVGESIAAAQARVIRSPAEIGSFRPGEILVTETTDPDWEPIMKRAAAIVTERGGRTSHAAIVARELGIPAIVGASGARSAMKSGETVTVSCAEGSEGVVYRGEVPYEMEEVDVGTIRKPQTAIELNVANPEKALRLAALPSDGVGLARMEFVFASWVQVHPLALTRFHSLPADEQKRVEALTAGYDDKAQFFVDRLSQGIGLLAAAFYPRQVILRFSDFKTNEYAKLVGGEGFEPAEENPMLGWRGASRYYHPDYKEGFLLEVAAVRRVRDEFGLRNLAVMVPFCRTPEEGRRVLDTMREGGLVRGVNGLEVWVMAELPSNVILAEQFARDFDGFSIGSNDLTQLTLGLDRDSATVAPLFDERNDAVKWSCAHLIREAHRVGRKVGICGQAPSDYPEFAAFLVEQGIDSISLSADALLPTILRVREVEDGLKRQKRAERRPGEQPAH